MAKITKKSVGKATAKPAASPSLPGNEQASALLYEALETELGGVQLYRAAIECALNPDLRKEWKKYLAETEEHVRRLKEVCTAMGLDPEVSTPGRLVVAHIGKALVQAIRMAKEAGNPVAAQLVAAECVTLAETKDHLNWSLIGELIEEDALEHAQDSGLVEAWEEIEEQEDQHLYHSEGWARELWLESLGLPAQLPPPEEEEDVKSMAEAAAAKAGRKKA